MHLSFSFAWLSWEEAPGEHENVALRLSIMELSSCPVWGEEKHAQRDHFDIVRYIFIM